MPLAKSPIFTGYNPVKFYTAAEIHYKSISYGYTCT